MSCEKSYDVIVVGSGPAGQKAAIQAAKAGKRVLVVEQESGVGGACVKRGTIPSKTLRETALALGSLRKKSGGVVDPSLPDEVRIESLLARVDQVVGGHEKFLAAQLERNGVARLRGRARFVPSRSGERGGTVAVSQLGGELKLASAPIVVVAVGSRPRTPPGIPIDHEHLLDSDSLLSMSYLPQSMVVLGAGVIACEYASIFAELGVEVTLVDKFPRPLGFCDGEIVDRFVAAFERTGGRLIANAEVVSAEFDGICTVVTTLKSGEVIESEKLFSALGRVANVDGLGLEVLGLAPNARGLLEVDATFQTKAHGVYAVGDVIGPPALAASSMEQGRRAMCHALGLPLHDAAALVPAGVYTIPEIGSVGLGESEAREKYGAVIVGRARFDEIARGHIAAIDDGLLKLVACPEGKKILGVQVVGEGAAELVHVAQMAMIAGLEVDTFVDATFNFPTLAEAYRVAALDVAGQRATPKTTFGKRETSAPRAASTAPSTV